MKNFFVGAGRKIFRFFWSWGFLKFVLIVITLFILLYVEEDWRGARAWAATKAKWEAKGETFDLGKFRPAPISDSQNLAAIPIFKIEQVEYAPGKFDPQLSALDKAMQTKGFPGGDLPPRGIWMMGQLPDMEKFRSAIATDFDATFKGASLPLNSLEQWDELYPFLADLRAASAIRPHFQIPQDYTISPPASRPLGNVVKALKLAQFLTIDALLSLDEHQADRALEDIRINYKLLWAAKSDPSLVGGLVAIGVNAITLDAVYYGLISHAWNDDQLAEIDHILKPINFVSDYQFAVRSEAAVTVTNLNYFEHARMGDIYSIFGFDREKVPIAFRMSLPWPSGWWDQNKAQMADFTLSMLPSADLRTRRFFPENEQKREEQMSIALNRWDANAPWNIWFTMAAGPLGRFDQQYAFGQTWVNEARIACALERYYLMHRAYPDSLDSLSPAFIDSVPHDVINGQPYRYKLQPDGAFLLYSVGWNQTDEGGKIVCTKETPIRIDKSQGDWVWPTPQKK